jgi:Kelch motif
MNLKRFALVFLFFLASVVFVSLSTAEPVEMQEFLHLSAYVRDLQAAPGDIVSFILNLRNYSELDRNVSLDYTDFHGWVISGPDQVFVPATDKATVEFSVRLPTTGTAVNDHITVTATSLIDVATLEYIVRRTWFERTASPTKTLMAASIYDPQLNAFWVVGGNDNDYLNFGLTMYNPVTDLWRDNFAQPDILVTGAGACLLDEHIYMVGGGLEDIVTFTDALQIYDVAADSWSMGPPMGEPSGLMSMGIACDPDRNRVWVVGGINSDFVPLYTVRYYDVAQDEWVSEGIASFQHPFWSIRSIYYKGFLRTVSLSNVSSYNIETNVWSDTGSLPYARVDTAYDRYGEYEYMVGGWRFGGMGEIVSDYSTIFRSIETGGDWTFHELVLPEALGPTSGAFGDQGRFFVFGGLSGGYGSGGISSKLYEYPLIEGMPDDHHAGESPETMLAYDDGELETEFYLTCTPCSVVQGFVPKLYPVKLLNFSWYNGLSGDQYPYTPHRIVVYRDYIVDGIPQSNTPIYRSELVEDGESNSWNTIDLSMEPELQSPIDAGEVFIGFEYFNPSPMSYRPSLGFDADSGPVERTWFNVQGQWRPAMSDGEGKVGVMMMRAGIEFLGEMPDDDVDDDADDDSDDDADDDQAPPTDDDEGGDDDDSDSDSSGGCGC